MVWKRSGPERLADSLRFLIKAGFLVVGIVGSALAAYVAIRAGWIFVTILEDSIFRPG